MFEICKDCVWRYRCPEMEDVNRDEDGCVQKRVHGQREENQSYNRKPKVLGLETTTNPSKGESFSREAKGGGDARIESSPDKEVRGSVKVIK